MNRANVLSGLVCLAFGMLLAALASQVPNFTITDQLGGRFFPMLVAIGIIICSIGLIITGLMNVEIAGGQVGGKRASAPDEESAEEVAEEITIEEPPMFGMPAPRARLFGFIASMAIYTFILNLIGYIAASLIIFAAMIMIAGERRPLPVALGAICITAVLYTLFAVIFGMNVPEASLF